MAFWNLGRRLNIYRRTEAMMRHTAPAEVDNREYCTFEAPARYDTALVCTFFDN
jgi:hypothetical protein